MRRTRRVPHTLEALKAADRRRLENALCTLVDYEGIVEDALIARGNQRAPVHDVCDALRAIVDGEIGGSP